MNSEEHKALKDALALIQEEIDKGNLSLEEKEAFESTSAQIAGLLCRAWFPRDLGRRLIMLLIMIIGFIGLVYDHKLLMLCWLVLPLFSPRLMGEVLFAIGSVKNSGKGDL
ncbi:MAG: hypothetical protein Q7U10_11785 [Thermodesulfovibrionia bacterium]|nr:hypothetical protein [Thermodesulfovibrionia bacterium]